MTDEFLKTYANLSSTCQRVVKFKLSHPNATKADLSRLVETSTSAMTQLFKNNPGLQECFDILEKDIVSQIKDLYPLAVLAFRRALMSKNEDVALKAADKILSRIMNEHPAMMPDFQSDMVLEFVSDELPEVQQTQH